MAAKVSPIQKLQMEQQKALAFSIERRTPFGVLVPKCAVEVSPAGFVQVPVYGTQIVVTQYQAKADYFVLIWGIVLGFNSSSSGPAPNPGDVSWRVDIDCPLGAANQGYPLKNWGARTFNFGSFVPGDPWPVDFRFRNGETLRVKGTPVANMGTGAGNVFTAGLFGYEWPEDGQEA